MRSLERDMDNRAVFIDANIFIYFLDESSAKHKDVVKSLQALVDNEHTLYTSHHVLEEVLFIVSKLVSKRSIVSVAVETIATMPGLCLIEPVEDFEFIRRYSSLYQKSQVGINDALLLQLIIDGNIKKLFSYDKAFLKTAGSMGIGAVLKDEIK